MLVGVTFDVGMRDVWNVARTVKNCVQEEGDGQLSSSSSTSVLVSFWMFFGLIRDGNYIEAGATLGILGRSALDLLLNLASRWRSRKLDRFFRSCLDPWLACSILAFREGLGTGFFRRVGFFL